MLSKPTFRQFIDKCVLNKCCRKEHGCNVVPVNEALTRFVEDSNRIERTDHSAYLRAQC